MKNVIKVALLSGVLFYSCGGNETNTKSVSDTKNKTEEKITIPDDWKIIDENDFSIKHPSDWAADFSNPRVKFMLKSPKESDADRFIENINYLDSPLPSSDISLDKFAELNLKYLRKSYPDVNVTKEKKIKKWGKDVYELEYDANMAGNELKFNQLYWIENDKGHIFTYTAGASGFETFKKTADKIISSFNLK